MKRILSILAITLAATAAFAQRPAPPPGGPNAGPGGPPPGAILVQYLGLTNDQKAAWDAAQKDFRTATQPLHDQLDAAQQKVHDLMSSGSTDATAIGTAMLAVRAIQDQIKSMHDALETKLDGILTADQKTKYDAFEAATAFLRSHGPGPR